MATLFNEFSDIRYDPPGQNGRIGMVALATDVWSDKDLAKMSPEGVEIYTNRVMNENPVRIENQKSMADDMVRAAKGLLPGGRLDALLYSCTSGTVSIGEERVIDMLKQVRPEACVTTPVTAAKAAMRKMSMAKICILTPYVESVNRAIADYFSSQGFEVTQVTGFSIDSDDDMTGVDPQSIYQAAIRSFDPDCDGLFISCTALRSSDVIDIIEAEIGKPVVSSNQAMLWHVLEMMTKPYHVCGYGRLFDHRLA